MSDEQEHRPNDIAHLSFGQAVSRGLRLRCPACAQGKLFRDLFRMNPQCSDCGFRFERPAGYFLGSTYINYGCTSFVTTVSYVTLLFGCGVSKERLLPGALAFCLIFPLVFFRFARSLWLSLDCCLDRVGASEAMPRTLKPESGSEVADNGNEALDIIEDLDTLPRSPD